METGWALVPEEKEPRFVAVDARYPIQRIVRLTPPDLTWSRPVAAFSQADFVRVDGHEHALPSIGWRGIVYAAPSDGHRAERLLRVAEAAVRFFLALRARFP